MVKLRVRAIAEAKGWNMSQLQRKSGVTMPSVRRYWYNTKDGRSEGDPIREVDLMVLKAMADALDVGVIELFDPESDMMPPAAAPGWTPVPLLALG